MTRVSHPSTGKRSTYDGSGTKTSRMMTGMGAPSPRGPGRNKLLSNNWGAHTLSKLQTTSGAAFAGRTRFVQPTEASTALAYPPGLGAPHGID